VAAAAQAAVPSGRSPGRRGSAALPAALPRAPTLLCSMQGHSTACRACYAAFRAHYPLNPGHSPVNILKFLKPSAWPLSPHPAPMAVSPHKPCGEQDSPGRPSPSPVLGPATPLLAARGRPVHTFMNIFLDEYISSDRLAALPGTRYYSRPPGCGVKFWWRPPPGCWLRLGTNRWKCTIWHTAEKL
jgi:hypothetical protein